MKKKNDNNNNNNGSYKNIYEGKVKTVAVLHPHYHRQLSRREGRNWQQYLKQKENFCSALNCVGYIDI
jgi:hypothetical protein